MQNFSLRQLLILTAGLLLILSGSAVRAELKAGAARVSIVPPFPTHMGGFMDRTGTFEGVHDEVFARALVLDNGTTQLAVISSDLTAVDGEMTRQIREVIEERIGIPAAHVMVSCAHNHSAPSLYEPGRLKESESPVKPFFVKQFSEVVIEAFHQRRPARLGFHAGRLVGLTRNRQQDNDLIDPQVGVTLVQEADSRTVIATLFNFTGHPVIIGSSNLQLSGEYPGAASRAVENLLGGVALFTQGAAGDITVHRSGDPFEEIERVGRTVAAEVIKSAGFIRPRGSEQLAAATRTLELSSREVPSLADAEQAAAEGQQQLKDAQERQASEVVLKGIRRRQQMHSINLLVARRVAAGEMDFPDSYSAEVQVMRIGDLILASIPGEIFVEYALELRSRVTQDTGLPLCLVGYSNGYIGYIVTPRAQRTGGYEASVARVRPGAGRAMIEAAVELVHEITQ